MQCNECGIDDAVYEQIWAENEQLKESLRECYQIAQACEFGFEAAKAIREKFSERWE